MKILITGAGGFVGKLLAARLLRDGQHQLILTDVVDNILPVDAADHGKATVIKADLLTETAKVVQQGLEVVYILHGIMSSGAETDFGLGMKVNFDSTRNLLEHIRKLGTRTRVIYASSIAVYGRPFPTAITEDAFPTPEGAYGCEKMLCEALINEYTRRSYIDGFIVRLPGISVRPGLPAQAASSFLSGIIREPLVRRRCLIPTKDRSRAFWVCSPKILIKNLVHLLELPSTALPKHRRALNLPGTTVKIQEMMDALAVVGGADKLQYIDETDDAAFGDLVQSWPCIFDTKLAITLGFHAAESFEQAVYDHQRFMEDHTRPRSML
jgi:nucleoside-diphosphate-sugar epimerase